MNSNGQAPDPDASGWDILTLADAYEPRPPTEYIVDKFFATESLNIFYGAPGSFKSLILADMCAHIVAGTGWLPGLNGSEGIAVKPSPVFWLDLDNGRRRTNERMEAVARANDLAEDAPFFYVSMPTNPHFTAASLDAMIMLRGYINHYDAKLVVIDNLSLITGDVEENRAEMATIMGNLRILAERTQAAVVVIHHQRKGGSDGRPGDALRGHSSIEAAIDLALHVVRESNTNEVTITSTKTRGVDVPSVIARFQFEHRLGTSDLYEAWFDGKPVIRGDNPIREAILKVLDEHGPLTKGRLRDEVHDALQGSHGLNRISNWITDMAEMTDELVVETGEYNAKIISRRGAKPSHKTSRETTPLEL